ncbi:MAG: A24 family peptidase [Dehalococcoidia bacterium]
MSLMALRTTTRGLTLPPYARSAAALAGIASVAAAAALALDVVPLAAAAVAGTLLYLVAVVTVDLRERRVPNVWTYPATVGALLLAAITGPSTFLVAVAGLALGGGVLALLAAVTRGAIGMGDVKLGAAAGAVLGPAGAVTLLLAGSAAGGVLAVVWLIAGGRRREAMPYAPALALGALAALALNGPVVA